MTEKEFLKVLVNKFHQLGFMFKNYSDQGLEKILDHFLEEHHKEYYEVEFIKIDKERDEMIADMQERTKKFLECGKKKG